MVDSHVRFEIKGFLGIATLNRPAAINALSGEMFKALRCQIKAWISDPQVKLIVLRGAGEKGFCAGGDVKSLVLTLNARSDLSHALEFFVDEYSLDYLIHTSKKPILALSHGLTLGGGIGLFAGAACRVVTETSVLAMPEIAIGYFTDVGSSYFLNQMPGHLGRFLALGAIRFQASDALYLGLADVYVEQAKVPALLEYLEQRLGSVEGQSDGGSGWSRAQLRAEVKNFGSSSGLTWKPSLFETYFETLNVLCQADSILDIERRWRKLGENLPEGFPWSLEAFFSGSPTSAALIFEQLRRGKGMSLKECFDMELNLALACCQRSEFREGVRAQLIDKDRHPQWRPQNITDVDLNEIQRYFSQEHQITVDSES